MVEAMPQFRERIAGLFAATSSTGVALRVTGDTQDRVTLDAGGRISWGTGSATPDTTLQRTGTTTLTLNGTLVATLSGNATTATTLQTARTITIGDTGKSFNGSANVSWTLAEMGVLARLGATSTSGTLDWNAVSNTRPGTGVSLLLGSATNGPGGGNYYHPFNLEYASKDGSGNVTQLAVAYGTPANEIYMRGRYQGTWTSWVRLLNSNNYNSYSPTLTGTGANGTWGISVTGNAGTATALQTARTIGGVSFNGTANINLPGVNTAGNQNTSGNAATATTLATARTIGDVSFNGSANIVPQRILYKDTRSSDYNPFTYLGVSLHLKTNGVDGLVDGGNYHGVLDLARWSDGTGGKDFQIAVTDNGNVYTRNSDTSTTWNAWRKLWSDANDGSGSGLDADLLDGQHATYFASQSGLEAVLGDLLNVGTYDAASNAPSTKPVPAWSGGPTVYRHGMYWIVSSSGDLDFLTVDLSQREGQNADGTTPVNNADWIIATNPNHDPANPDVNLAVGDIVWKWVSFSAENYVRGEIARHALDANDPHSAANYVTPTKGLQYFAPVFHNHDFDIAAAITEHEAKADPHPQYLIQAEGDVLYAPVAHNHNSLYEPIGLVAGHEAKTDPHPQYLTPGEGDGRYTLIGHNHNDLYYTKAETDAAIAAVPTEVFATDGAQSRRIFVGDATPSSPAAGDIWIETSNVALQPPAAPSGLSATSPNGTTVNLSWSAWPSGAAQTRVRVQRRNGSDWTTVAPTTLLDDTTTPYALTFSDTGRTENTQYFYRVWANNTAGDGAYGYVDVTTANDAPGAPTGLTVSSQTATGMRLSWTAPTPFVDPAASGARYEVFLNGSSIGFAASTNTFFDYTGLTERTSYTLGVRAKDSAGLVSTIASTTTGATTGNAAPPPPKSAASSGVTHNQATLTWAAGDPIIANGHPAGGITDFLRYRVYSNDTEVAQTTNTSYTFTGLSPSTSYKLEVRSEDTLNALSTDNSAGSFVNITTLVNPDTTPPAAPTITYFKPVGSYGRMEVNGSWPSDADTNYGEISYYPGNGDPVVLWQGTISPGASFTRNFFTNGGYTEVAGQTPTVFVRARDANNNWSASAQSSYTLIESPYLLAADSSNSWRNESGGRYNFANNYRLYQGYFSNPTYNSIGLWYYGTKIQDQVYYGGRRTITNAEIYMQRNTGGDGVPRDVSIVLHSETTNPGNAYTTGPTTYETPTVVATLQWGGGSAWATVPSGWRASLVNGTRRGVAIRDTDGIPYVVLDSVGENSQSGTLRFTHLG